MRDVTSMPSPIEPTVRAWLTTALRRAGHIEPGATFEATPIGMDRGMTSRVARMTWGGSRPGTAVIKIPAPAPTHDFERSCREVHFYAHLGARAGVRTPNVIASTIDEARQHVALLIEDVRGTDGDAATGCAPADVASIVAGIARMHARWWRDETLADHAWLPRWGRGVAGVDRPHARRAARFRGRIDPFLDRYGADTTPELARIIRALADRAEDVLARTAALPPTLIHADLHLDNVVFVDAAPPANVVLLDWQSASFGPGTYDLARLLVDALPDRSAHARIPSLVDAYFETLAAAGMPARDLRAHRDAWPVMLACVLIGFVSGYGGRTPESLSERERRMVRRSLSADGLGGVVPDAVDALRLPASPSG